MKPQDLQNEQANWSMSNLSRKSTFQMWNRRWLCWNVEYYIWEHFLSTHISVNKLNTLVRRLVFWIVWRQPTYVNVYVNVYVYMFTSPYSVRWRWALSGSNMCLFALHIWYILWIYSTVRYGDDGIFDFGSVVLMRYSIILKMQWIYNAIISFKSSYFENCNSASNTKSHLYIELNGSMEGKVQSDKRYTQNEVINIIISCMAPNFNVRKRIHHSSYVEIVVNLYIYRNWIKREFITVILCNIAWNGATIMVLWQPTNWMIFYKYNNQFDVSSLCKLMAMMVIGFLSLSTHVEIRNYVRWAILNWIL